ncbi:MULTISPECIES: disulfide bond formation protein DsbB [Shewanella]|uniref:Disulfide bond formation protein B n=1 Tax=Shewanella salipaludis TaxID=2723052 RepID=A0A972JHA4_9GAMM|nr:MULTISPECIES: disulfide bond formation protein DsbB [Shewanella]MCE9687423.1 disulfide bond formation protein DsbB [Shewanella sp. AS16]NMH63788.1 disulfide bond formation protein DsbB [Shewanella salipaludis]
MNPVTRFAHTRNAWLILTLSALALEVAALSFQYLMKLDPCVMCIYQRLAVFGLLGAGLMGLVAPGNLLCRCLAALVWGISASWGLKIALALVALQTDPSPFATCAFLPEFPSWMPLHQWLPSVFMPTGMCTDIPWMFMGVTMAQWMVVAFSLYLIALLIFIAPIMSKK